MYCCSFRLNLRGGTFLLILFFERGLFIHYFRYSGLDWSIGIVEWSRVLQKVVPMSALNNESTATATLRDTEKYM